jgi:hypothetical protein
MKKLFHLAWMAAVCFVTAGNAWSTTLISDDYETDSSANYTVQSQDPFDGTVTFAFDYVAAGIPLAPRSAPGTSKGVKFTANDVFGATNTQTAFHNTDVSLNVYKLTVDVFMNVQPTEVTLTASTEHAHVGVGGDGLTPNALFTPISGSGSFMAFTGDGGSGSDYRWFLASANGGPTTYPNSHHSYLGNGSNNTGAFYSALFPSPPSRVVGSPGNIWTTVEVLVNNTTGRIQYYMTNTTGTKELIFDNNPAITIPPDNLPTPFTGVLDGLVSLGLHDAFTSVDDGSVFTVFDNMVVEEVTEGPVAPQLVNARPYHNSFTGPDKVDSSVSLIQRGANPLTAELENIISSSQGINGVVLDFDNLAALNDISLEYKWSPPNVFTETIDQWGDATAPDSVTLLPDAGQAGSDRVLLTWIDNAVANRYLCIKVIFNGNTIAELYLGHLRGEMTGSSAGKFTILVGDILAVRSQLTQPKDATGRNDVDKSGTILVQDILDTRSNLAKELSQLTVPAL